MASQLSTLFILMILLLLGWCWRGWTARCSQTLWLVQQSGHGQSTSLHYQLVLLLELLVLAHQTRVLPTQLLVLRLQQLQLALVLRHQRLLLPVLPLLLRRHYLRLRSQLMVVRTHRVHPRGLEERLEQLPTLLELLVDPLDIKRPLFEIEELEYLALVLVSDGAVAAFLLDGLGLLLFDLLEDLSQLLHDLAAFVYRAHELFNDIINTHPPNSTHSNLHTPPLNPTSLTFALRTTTPSRHTTAPTTTQPPTNAYLHIEYANNHRPVPLPRKPPLLLPLFEQIFCFSPAPRYNYSSTIMSFLLQKNLSPHLLLHLLALTQDNSSPQSLLQKLNLLSRTRQFDLISQTANAVNMHFPSLANKLEIAKKESQAQKEKLGISKVFQRLIELDEMSKVEDPNFELIDQEHIKIFELSKILFEEGNYTESLKILVQLEKQQLKEQLWLKSTWARLYCQILLSRDDTLRTLQALKRKIDEIEAQELSFLAKQKKNNAASMKRFYAQREEFLILALFVVFRKAGDDQLEKWVDYCTADKGLFSVLQLTCPELLRYVIAAVILNKTLQNNKENRTFDFFKLVEVINRKIVKHNDAFTEFVSLLEIDYDFESAIAKIQNCRTLIRSDPFLCPFEDKLIQGLHFLYFKQACKVYETIPLSEIASFTGLPIEEAELWLLGYIRSGDIDAKIDSIAELVVNNKGRQSSSEKYVDVIPGLGAFVAGLSRSVVTH